MCKNNVWKKLFKFFAFVFFDRRKSLFFCMGYTLISLVIEKYFNISTLFSCAGAIITIAGLFLNIKHSLNFHLNLDKTRLYNKLSGAGVFGTAKITKENEEWVDGIILDEIYGVSFMMTGTLIWAYGAFFVKFLN